MTTTAAAALATRWTAVVPLAALGVFGLAWHRDLPLLGVVLVSLFLAGAILAAVHHAEVIAHRVGEPYGSLVLAVAVTVIEVALIVTLVTTGAEGSETLARDTVFAAIMITTNGIVGISLLAATLNRQVAHFNAEGTGSALAAVGTIATLCLVLPTFTEGRSGPEFTPGQLTFAAVAALGLYALFVAMQTVRHRDYFLPTTSTGAIKPDEDHADPPTARAALVSAGFLLVALVAVVGNAKNVSPSIESGVRSAGLPQAVVGVLIALMILAPESIAAVRAARRKRVQISLNLAYGSAMASIGLTVPVIAIAQVWLDGPLVLGLGETELVLLVLTMITSVLTVVPGRATLLQGGIHIAILGAFLFLAASP
ncbi:MAG: ionic transporter y4hA [Aeromicrobium sp.]|jgi:Ca2+:H+ antiporter|uniref:calcium:proton antiporter n=1 Tax=Aeromicrobium sp. TaxID=1871063 RepID=UPI00261A3B9D|nr:ionic transporter y4hA [Aeromicrobium sp.]MCW2788532.1 ionic transporter y4hA [Aeromicrobium sp.]MCW2823640.1 ionic transporter y4hA [Aeromicrobium sp.]